MLESLRAGIAAHAEHQAAMREASEQIAAERASQAVASGLLNVGPDEHAPEWSEPTEQEGSPDGDRAA